MKEKMAELFKVSDWRLDETNEKRFLVEVYLASDRWRVCLINADEFEKAFVICLLISVVPF